MTTLEIIPFVWQPLPQKEVGERLQGILNSWTGTPYMLGQKTKGRGVDCVHFLTAVLDEMYGFARPPIDKLNGDRCLHSPESTRAAMRKLLGIYSPNRRITGLSIEPGDIIVTGPKGGGPGHAMIVSNIPNVLWHASAHGVCSAGSAYDPSKQTLFKTYRLLDKHRWTRC